MVEPIPSEHFNTVEHNTPFFIKLGCMFELMQEQDKENLRNFIFANHKDSYYLKPDKQGRFWRDSQQWELYRLVQLGFITETRSNKTYTVEHKDYSTGERSKEKKYKYYYELTEHGKYLVDLFKESTPLRKRKEKGNESF